MHTDILTMFETPHAPLAAYLVTKFVPLVTIRIDKKRGTFVFHQVPRQFIIEFNDGTALTEPNVFAETMSQIIQRARTALEEHNNE